MHFPRVQGDLERTNFDKHKINVGEYLPIRQSGRWLPLGKQEKIRKTYAQARDKLKVAAGRQSSRVNCKTSEDKYGKRRPSFGAFCSG